MVGLTLSPSSLEETEGDTGIVQRFADEISSLGRDMVILLSEDHDQLSLNIAHSLERIVLLSLTKSGAVDISSKVAHGGSDPWVQSTTVSQVATEAHSRGADSAIAGLEGEEKVDGEGAVLVVGGDLLCDFPFVARVGAGAVVGEGLGAGEFVVGTWCCYYEALASNLTGETLDGTGHCG